MELKLVVINGGHAIVGMVDPALPSLVVTAGAVIQGWSSLGSLADMAKNGPADGIELKPFEVAAVGYLSEVIFSCNADAWAGKIPSFS